MRTAESIAAESRQADRIAVMTEFLKPHAHSSESLWDAMPDAFRSAYGREVDKEDAHDVMLCHAALAPFQMENEPDGSPSSDDAVSPESQRASLKPGHLVLILFAGWMATQAWPALARPPGLPDGMRSRFPHLPPTGLPAREQAREHANARRGW